jgi:glycosyltransferase involved in cell wall biosynthesis
MKDSRIEIVHCLEAVRSGGVERRRLSLAQCLPKDRFKQSLICTEISDELREAFTGAGCDVFAVGQVRHGLDWRIIRRAAKVLRQIRPDIVHGAVFEGVELAALAGRLARVPIIVGEETSDPHGRRWTGHLYYRFLAALTDRMVAVSPAVSRYLICKLWIPPSKVRTILNGVRNPGPAPAQEVEQLRRDLDLKDGDFVIGTVGRMVDKHKRMSDAIRALKIMLGECPGARLIVVGDGPDRAALEALADELGVRDAVCFVGYQGRVRPYLDLMDVLVHPAASEAFGLVLVEAMFARLPVVATAVGGIPKVVEDQKTGLLVPPGDPAKVADRLLFLWRNPAVREQMGAAGAIRARATFSESRYVEEVAALYESLYRHCRRRRNG